MLPGETQMLPTISEMGIALAIADRSCYRGHMKSGRESAAELVRSLRSGLGLTQEELARKLGVSFSTVNGWENRKHSPHPVFLRQIREMDAAVTSQPKAAHPSGRKRKT